VQDPDPYMREQQIRVPCLMTDRIEARIEESLRASLNFEIFYFSDSEARRRFEADPTRWCGPLTDPVTLQRFVPTKRSPVAEAGGRRFYFVSDKTRQEFAARPDSFSVPHFRMRQTTPSPGSDRT